MLGVVLELLIVEEELLACCEHKLGAAVNAFQHSIGEFHGRLPSQGLPPKSAMALQETCRSRFPEFVRRALQGPGPHLKQGGIRTFARMRGQPYTSHANRVVSDLSRFSVSAGIAISRSRRLRWANAEVLPIKSLDRKLEKRSSQLQRRGCRSDFRWSF